MFSQRCPSKTPEEIGKNLAKHCILDMDFVPQAADRSGEKLATECRLLIASIYTVSIIELLGKYPEYAELALGVFFMWERDAYNLTDSKIFEKRLDQYSEIAIEHFNSNRKGTPSEELGRAFHFNRNEGREISLDAFDVMKSTKMATLIWNQALSKLQQTIS